MDRQYLGCHCKFSIYLLHITSMGCIADCYMAKHWKCNATVSIQFDSSIDIVVVAIVHSFISLCLALSHFIWFIFFSWFFPSFFDRRFHSVDVPSNFHRTKLHWNRIQSRFHSYLYSLMANWAEANIKQQTLIMWLMIKIEEQKQWKFIIESPDLKRSVCLLVIWFQWFHI